MSEKEPYTSAKEPNISAKEPHTSAKEPYSRSNIYKHMYLNTFTHRGAPHSSTYLHLYLGCSLLVVDNCLISELKL